MIDIKEIGGRFYIGGETYALRDQLRKLGCSWDQDRREWWTANADVAAKVRQLEPDAAHAGSGGGNESRYIYGVGKYRGRSYYIAARRPRDARGKPEMVTAQDGARMLLYFKDGSSQFWVNSGDVEVTKTYRRSITIDAIQRYLRECRENGGTHPDACPNCGSTGCSAAYGRGGLCDDD